MPNFKGSFDDRLLPQRDAARFLESDQIAFEGAIVANFINHDALQECSDAHGGESVATTMKSHASKPGLS